MWVVGAPDWDLPPIVASDYLCYKVDFIRLFLLMSFSFIKSYQIPKCDGQQIRSMWLLPDVPLFYIP